MQEDGSRARGVQGMKAHEIMIRQVHKVKETDTLRDVIEKFIKYRISGLPVVNERNEIVGYISDGDIMRYIGHREDFVLDAFYFSAVMSMNEGEYDDRTRRLLGRNVMELSRKKVVAVSQDEDVAHIAGLLGRKQIKKVPVHRGGVLVGIISRGDVIRHSFGSYLTEER